MSCISFSYLGHLGIFLFTSFASCIKAGAPGLLSRFIKCDVTTHSIVLSDQCPGKQLRHSQSGLISVFIHSRNVHWKRSSQAAEVVPIGPALGALAAEGADGHGQEKL